MDEEKLVHVVKFDDYYVDCVRDPVSGDVSRKPSQIDLSMLVRAEFEPLSVDVDSASEQLLITDIPIKLVVMYTGGENPEGLGLLRMISQESGHRNVPIIGVTQLKERKKFEEVAARWYNLGGNVILDEARFVVPYVNGLYGKNRVSVAKEGQYSVLVVDSRKTERETIVSIIQSMAVLKRKSYVVQEVGNYKEALEALSSGSYDVVLMSMECKDGLGLPSAIETGMYGNPSLIGMTALMDTDKVKTWLANGGYLCLEKTVHPNVLFAAVDMCAEHRLE